MQVSLITTVRNEAGSVAALAAAIAAQTRRPDEWIVVDGGSTDDTLARLREATAALNLAVRITEAAGNIAHGRNTAIAASTGALVAVTDAGCVPEAGWLQALVAPLAEDRCDVAAGATRGRLRSPLDVAQWTLLDQFLGPRATWRAPTLSSRSLVFRRGLAGACGYPEWLDHGEDRWLLEEWQRRGARLLFVDAPGAAVVWDPRPSLASFLKQHFLYMRGDGIGGLRGGRNALRLAAHAVLVAGLTLGTPLAAGLAWTAYCLATLAARWPEAARGQGPFDRALSLLLVPPLLALMDGAKIAGYVAGRAERALRAA